MKFQLNGLKEQLNDKDRLIFEIGERVEKLEEQQQQQQLQFEQNGELQKRADEKFITIVTILGVTTTHRGVPLGGGGELKKWSYGNLL